MTNASCVVAALLLAGAAVVADAALKAANYKDAVPCHSKVSSLATEIQNLLSDNQRVELSCARSLKYYKDMVGHKEKSITHLEDMTQRHDSDAELTAEYTDSYTTMMCMKSYNAFFGDKDQEARLEVLHLCMGRKSLAPSSLLRHAAHVDRSITTDVHDCPQAASMQERVDLLRATKKTKVAECKVKKAELRKELDETDAREDELEGKLYGHHDDKTEIRSKVAAEVTAKFCNVITPNYKLQEEKIQDFWSKNCPT